MWPLLSAPSTDWLSGEWRARRHLPLPHTHPRPARGQERAQAEEGVQRDACGLEPCAGGSEDLGAAFCVGSGQVFGKDSVHPRKG